MPLIQEVIQSREIRKITSDFRGGLIRSESPTKLLDDQYCLLFNGRTRDGVITPVRLPSSLATQVPATRKLQGVYGFGATLLIFVDGKPYYKDFLRSPNASFRLISDVILDTNVDTIYAEAVPASFINLKRSSAVTGDASGIILGNISEDNITIANSPGSNSCIICQDGLHQPFLIFADLDTRLANTFQQWSYNEAILDRETREYVPVGKQMLWYDGILYMVSPNSKEIYRSVSGRPLDFVVAVDKDGNKLDSDIPDFIEASRLSYKVGNNTITALSTSQQGLFVSTSLASYIVTPNYDRTIFGEPTFTSRLLFGTGCVNQFSITESNGDTVIIDSKSIVSFNAVAQFLNEGKNAPFSRFVQPLLTSQTQTTPAAITFDNYSFFAVSTIYGNAILVFDNISQKFVSIDLYPNITGTIRQFAQVSYGSTKRLFFATETNLYEAFTGDIATCTLYTKEFIADDTLELEQIPRRVRVFFNNIRSSGTLTLKEFSDGRAGNLQTRAVSARINAPSYPITIPFGNENAISDDTFTFVFFNSLKCLKTGLLISFNADADLHSVEYIGDIIPQKVTTVQGANVYS